MQRSTITPSLFDQMLGSAPNAKSKGLAQYFTPAKTAVALARPLPAHRPAIVDFTCGDGTLLRGAKNDTTDHRLGCDIDGSAFRVSSSAFLSADLTLFAPLLDDVEFRADLFVLNPPWDLHWHRDRLRFLDQSPLHTVRAAFEAHDGRTARGTIDSCVATLCLALHFGTDYSEGYLIMNRSTARRLILGEEGAPASRRLNASATTISTDSACGAPASGPAPHADLLPHIWAVLDLPAGAAAPVESTILYFARDHLSGPQITVGLVAPREPDSDPLSGIGTIHAHRYRREGAEAHAYNTRPDTTVTLWNAAAEEYQRLHPQPSSLLPLRSGERAGVRCPRPYNVWLQPDGHIGAHVSVYDEKCGRVPVAEAAALHSLKGKRPMQLVVQRAQREVLLKACGAGTGSTPSVESPWRIDPALQAAVRDALRDYHAARAPLYPLPAIQRLGFLDEEDWIHCRNPLSKPGTCNLEPETFLSGRRYAITTGSRAVRRLSQKIHLDGQAEDMELTGQELAIFITGEDGRRHCFMEARLLDDSVTIECCDEPRPTTRSGEPMKKENLPTDRFVPARDAIDFTLQQLVESFIVPDVPDVSTVNPEGYRRNLELLEQIETMCR